MSTRSVIARPVGDEWEGRYHHSDGYPTGLGAELWRLVQLEGVEWTRKTLIDDHPAGWSFIIGADWSQAPGFSNKPYDTVNGQFQQVDFRAHCYCHGDRKERAQIYRSRDEKKNEALFIEWVYVIGALGLAVYAAQPIPGKVKRNRMKDKRTGEWRTWDSPFYGWVYVDTFPYNGAEPDWKAIEEKAAA